MISMVQYKRRIKISDKFSGVIVCIFKRRIEMTHITLRSWLEDFNNAFLPKTFFEIAVYFSPTNLIKNGYILKSNNQVMAFIFFLDLKPYN